MPDVLLSHFAFFYLAAMLPKVIQENKKVIYFLLRFLSLFGGLSIIYAAWIKSFGDEADTFSWWVGYNLRYLFGPETLSLKPIEGFPAVAIDYLGNSAVSLFEGCNGAAVFILFFAFVFAFKGRWSDLLWFVPVGLIVIHLFNLARLAVLIVLAESDSSYFHFMHKYLFSLIIYVAVFILWVGWVKLVNYRTKKPKDAV